MDWPLQHVLVTEQKYRKSVEQLNLVQKRYVTQAQANLHNFELTEEQHGEYLKDHFGRFMNVSETVRERPCTKTNMSLLLYLT